MLQYVLFLQTRRPRHSHYTAIHKREKARRTRLRCGSNHGCALLTRACTSRARTPAPPRRGWWCSCTCRPCTRGCPQTTQPGRTWRPRAGRPRSGGARTSARRGRRRRWSPHTRRRGPRPAVPCSHTPRSAQRSVTQRHAPPMGTVLKREPKRATPPSLKGAPAPATAVADEAAEVAAAATITAGTTATVDRRVRKATILTLKKKKEEGRGGRDRQAGGGGGGLAREGQMTSTTPVRGVGGRGGEQRGGGLRVGGEQAGGLWLVVAWDGR